MDQAAHQLFDSWEEAIKVDQIPKRMTEVRDQIKIAEFAEAVLSSMNTSLKHVHGDTLPTVNVGALSIWDFTALVGRDRLGTYGVGVGIGSVRLLDVFSACLSAVIFENSDQADNRAQTTLGAVLYDYARRKVHRLRHWVMDPTLGLAIPYGFVGMQLNSMVPKGAERAHKFYLNVLLGWVLAHEVSHIAAGDIEDDQNVTVLGLTGQPIIINASCPRPDREYNADFAALRTLFIQYPETLPPVFTAISYFLGVLGIIERISTESVFSGPNHPSPVERLERMIRSLPEAAPQTSPSELQRVQDIGMDFIRFSTGIAEWILDAPEDFRKYPFVIEDYQENPEGNDLATLAAKANNAGDVKFATGDFASALQCYMEAEETCRGADYGEGHRIVWTNLIRTTCALGQLPASRRWLLEGLRVAKKNYDKPTILKLVNVFRRAVDSYGHNAPFALASDVQAVVGPLDHDMRAAIEA